jgi:hypothetical protein
MNCQFRFHSIWLAAATITLAWKSSTWAQSVQGAFTVPNGLENVEGNSVGWHPFDGLLTPSRYQQVFAASQFSSISNGGTIAQIHFRRNSPCGGSAFATISNLQINLSTTSKSPDSLSRVFAENVGSDESVVFGPNQIILGSSCGGGVPEAFEFGIGFTSPFFYNPRAGNLLLDIRNISGTSNGGNLLRIDGQDVTGDSVSSILGSNAGQQGTASSFGFVTYFSAFPIPDLAIFRQSSNVLIRWSYRAGNYMLEQSPALGSNANWQLAGGSVGTNGLYKEVTLPLDSQADARFFRLVLPLDSLESAETPLLPPWNKSQQQR